MLNGIIPVGYKLAGRKIRHSSRSIVFAREADLVSFIETDSKFSARNIDNAISIKKIEVQ